MSECKKVCHSYNNECSECLQQENNTLRDLLLQVQDHMSQLSIHCDEEWAISCADNVSDMIELKLQAKAHNKITTTEQGK